MPGAPQLAAVTSVLEAWSRAAASDWAGVAALETDLRAIPSGHPLAPDALRLRAGWRLERGEAPELRSALALIDRLLPQSHMMEDVVARARVLNRLGEVHLALATLLEVVRSSPADSRHALLDQVAAAVSEISEDEELVALRDRLAVEIAGAQTTRRRL